ncbi:MAG: hypothetical protein ACLVJ8_15210 [Ruthenibacterium lactatiformans]
MNTWQTALRNYVSFTTYDNADFTASKVAAGTTGGAKIRWVVDELRLAGVRVDPNTGKAFKVVNAGKIISWDEAFSLARAYDPDIGTNGRLAEITNAFQLKATVPMYVCMYAYNGDGEVVEPTEYGITNYSNGSIRVTDINVDSTGGGFLITDKAPLDLLRGEMSMNMFGALARRQRPANRTLDRRSGCIWGRRWRVPAPAAGMLYRQRKRQR